MSPTVQVDVVVLQHLLNFWDNHNIDINPIWKVLDIDATQPLPRWVAAERLSDVHGYLLNKGFSERLIVEAGRYLAEQNLPLTRLIRCGESLEKSLPQCIQFTHLTVGNVQFDLVARHESKTVRITAVEDSGCQCQLLMALSCLYSAVQCVLGHYASGKGLLLFLPQRFEHVADQFDLEVMVSDHFALEISLSCWQYHNPNSNDAAFRAAMREAERDDRKFREYLAIYDELKETLEQCLPERNVSQEGVAARMDISVRNLQRRLKALGTSYQNLLDEARQSLAMTLIEDGSTPLYEISFLVGYTEPSAFYKAFKRWTNKTPGEYRLALSTEKEKPAISAVSDEA